jgi:hypothetical protein
VLVKELQSLYLDAELLGTDGAVTSASEEQPIVIEQRPGVREMMPVAEAATSLFADEPKKDKKKDKKKGK